MLELLVEGSSGDHYSVKFVREGDVLGTSCTCQAGQKGIHCKHRLAILAGDISHIVGDVQTDLGTKIAAMLAGTNVAQALEQLHLAEMAVTAAQSDVKRAKKALDRVMHA